MRKNEIKLLLSPFENLNEFDLIKVFMSQFLAVSEYLTNSILINIFTVFIDKLQQQRQLLDLRNETSSCFAIHHLPLLYGFL